MDWLKIGLGLLKLFNTIADLFRSKKDRDAGRNEAVLEQHEATNAEIDKALAAKREQSARNDSGSVREPDPYSRD